MFLNETIFQYYLLCLWASVLNGQPHGSRFYDEDSSGVDPRIKLCKNGEIWIFKQVPSFGFKDVSCSHLWESMAFFLLLIECLLSQTIGWHGLWKKSHPSSSNLNFFSKVQESRTFSRKNFKYLMQTWNVIQSISKSWIETVTLK